MLTYQIRPRVLRIAELVKFPARCEINVYFAPDQPFGAAPGGGRTTTRAAGATSTFNANTGQHDIRSKNPLHPIEVRIEDPEKVVTFHGPRLSLVQELAGQRELAAMIDSVYFGVPVLLNVAFADPPYVTRVDGRIGDVPFRWELAEWRMRFSTTTQEQQETVVALAWDRMGILARPENRRLIAGLHYFHVACRLAREGMTAGEFVAEVLLNLAKSLEALFPSTGAGRSRDAIREGLRMLGYTANEIEALFLPVIALRNEVDVGHVELGLFSRDQLAVIHAYCEQAEGAFRQMLERLLSAIESGTTVVAPYVAKSASRRAAQVVDRMRRSVAQKATSRKARTST